MKSSSQNLILRLGGQPGKVQLGVVSEAAKEATLGILSEGDFFGGSK